MTFLNLLFNNISKYFFLIEFQKKKIFLIQFKNFVF